MSIFTHVLSGRAGMIQFEEELKKFYRSPEVGDIEDVIYNQDMTDATDLLFKIMQQDNNGTTNRR